MSKTDLLVRLTAAERAEINALANAKGVSPGDWVLQGVENIIKL